MGRLMAYDASGGACPWRRIERERIARGVSDGGEAGDSPRA